MSTVVLDSTSKGKTSIKYNFPVLSRRLTCGSGLKTFPYGWILGKFCALGSTFSSLPLSRARVPLHVCCYCTLISTMLGYVTVSPYTSYGRAMRLCALQPNRQTFDYQEVWRELVSLRTALFSAPTIMADHLSAKRWIWDYKLSRKFHGKFVDTTVILRWNCAMTAGIREDVAAEWWSSPFQHRAGMNINLSISTFINFRNETMVQSITSHKLDFHFSLSSLSFQKYSVLIMVYLDLGWLDRFVLRIEF